MAEQRITTRDARVADIDLLAALHAAGWRKGFAGIVPPELTPTPDKLAERMRERFADPSGARVVAEIAGNVRGFCFFGPSRDAEAARSVAEIYVLFVDPSAWRRGIGRALVEHAMRELEEYCEVTLWSAAENARANAFYESLGFALDGAEQARESFGNVSEVRYRRRV
jgi:ribosomal protein S18 acetylase RimI-like enzyme